MSPQKLDISQNYFFGQVPTLETLKDLQLLSGGECTCITQNYLLELNFTNKNSLNFVKFLFVVS
jgi:hypothetical protein